MRLKQILEHWPQDTNLPTVEKAYQTHVHKVPCRRHRASRCKLHKKRIGRHTQTYLSEVSTHTHLAGKACAADQPHIRVHDHGRPPHHTYRKPGDTQLGHGHTIHVHVHMCRCTSAPIYRLRIYIHICINIYIYICACCSNILSSIPLPTVLMSSPAPLPSVPSCP